MKKNMRGATLIEVLVSVGLLAVGGVIFNQSMQIQAKRAVKAEKESHGQRYEGLLRAQLSEAASDDIAKVANTGSCDWLMGFNVSKPTSGPNFYFTPEETIEAALHHVTYARSIHAEGAEDSMGIFARDSAGECANGVVEQIRLARGMTDEKPKLKCVLLTDYTGKVFGSRYHYMAQLSPTYYDFGTQQPIECEDWSTALSPGIRVDYALIWQTGTVNLPDPRNPGFTKNWRTSTAKTGFIEVQ